MDEELEFHYLLVDVIIIAKGVLMHKHGTLTMEKNLQKKIQIE